MVMGLALLPPEGTQSVVRGNCQNKRSWGATELLQTHMQPHQYSLYRKGMRTNNDLKGKLLQSLKTIKKKQECSVWHEDPCRPSEV